MKQKLIQETIKFERRRHREIEARTQTRSVGDK